MQIIALSILSYSVDVYCLIAIFLSYFAFYWKFYYFYGKNESKQRDNRNEKNMNKLRQMQ